MSDEVAGPTAADPAQTVPAKRVAAKRRPKGWLTRARLPARWREAAWRAAPWVIIGGGILLRVARYGANRSLWLDEAMVSLNITGRSFLELTEPLDYNQGAPIGFLFVEKLAVTLLGVNEYALRLFPLLAGIAALVLFYLLVRRVLERSTAAVVLTLFACSESLVYYASEVKQYSCDVACALLVLWLALRALHREGRGMDVLAVVGAVAIWFSHAVTFMLAGVGTALILWPLARRHYREAAVPVGMAGLWLLSFAAHYYMSLRNLSASGYLRDYWKYDFFPLPPRTWNDVVWYPMTLLRVVRDALDNLVLPTVGSKALAALAAAVVILGVVHLVHHHRRLLLMLALPLAFLTAASALQRYPIRGRLVLFLAPLALLLLGEGLQYIYQRYAGGRAIGRTFAAVLVGVALASGIWGVVRPPARDELRPVLEYVAKHADRSECLYLLAGSGPGTRFYVLHYPSCQPRDNKIIAGPWEVWVPKNKDMSELEEFLKVAPPQRVWLVFGTTSNEYYSKQEQRAVAGFDAVAPRLDEVRRPGAAAYLYDLTRMKR